MEAHLRGDGIEASEAWLQNESGGGRLVAYLQQRAKMGATSARQRMVYGFAAAKGRREKHQRAARKKMMSAFILGLCSP